MSTPDGDASSRLENALADVFAGGSGVAEPDDRAQPHRSAASGATDDWDVDGPDDGPDDEADDEADRPIALPVIVPATIDVPSEPVPTPAMPTAAGPAPTRPPATAWGDHMTTLPANAQGGALRAPGRRPRVRRVTRVLRHIDPWSTFKVALLFSVVAYLVSLTAGVLLWRVADSTGTLDNVERWFTQFGWETFEFDGGEIFHNAWIIGLFGAVALTGGLVLLATLFNLVSDIVGGVRMTVLEEEVVERTVSSTRRYVVRRAPATGGDGTDDWDVDDDAGNTPATPGGATAASGRATGPPSGPLDEWSIDGDDEHVDVTDDRRTESHDAPPVS